MPVVPKVAIPVTRKLSKLPVGLMDAIPAPDWVIVIPVPILIVVIPVSAISPLGCWNCISPGTLVREIPLPTKYAAVTMPATIIPFVTPIPFGKITLSLPVLFTIVFTRSFDIISS